MAIIPGQTEKNISIDTPQKQKNRRLTAIFIGVAFLAAGIIYFGFGSSQSNTPGTANMPPVGGNAMLTGGAIPASINGSPNPLTSKENQTNATLESLRKATLDNSIFSDKKLDSLKFTDKLPIVVGTKGRANPFAPF